MDKTLKCRECGREFAFTEGEQTFYASHGLVNEPGRCPSCRAARRAQRSESESDGAARKSTREMFPAVCAECGIDAQVPFLPRNDRPVYCSACFDKVRANR